MIAMELVLERMIDSHTAGSSRLDNGVNVRKTC